MREGKERGDRGKYERAAASAADQARARQEAGLAVSRTRRGRLSAAKRGSHEGWGATEGKGKEGATTPAMTTTRLEKISEKKGDDSRGEDAPYDALRPPLAVLEKGHVPVGTTRKLWSGPTYMSLQIPRMCRLITYSK